MSDKTFAKGFYFKPPHPKAPDFVKGQLSIKVGEARKWLATETDNEEWVNLDIKESKGGKYYLELNTWKADNKEHEPPTHPEDESSLPF